jgi:predicted amidohydrolase YtcJ
MRKSGLGWLGLGLLLGLGPAQAAHPADLILTGGAVYTLDKAKPWARAVAIAGGRIVYVGDDRHARRLRGSGTQIVDLHGQMVLPGFHDGHSHPMSGALRLLQCRLDGLENESAIGAAVRRCAAGLEKDRWLFGNGWSAKAFAQGGLTREKLDALVPDRPALLRNEDGYAGWANTKALALSGIDPDGTAPAIAGLARDPRSGKPTGLLTDDAFALVRSHVPPPSEAEYREALRRALAIANGFGVTSVFDASAKPAMLEAYHAADRAGDLTARIVAAQLVDPAKGPEQVDDFIALRDRVRGVFFHADAAKIFLDGEFGYHTAALLAPYSDAPDERGHLLIAKDRLAAIVRRLDEEDFLIHMHAMGDAAVRAGLDALAEAMAANGSRDRRPQLAHLGLVDVADIPRFARLGVTANIQPLWFQSGDAAAGETDSALGPLRVRWNFPVVSLLKAGARIVAGSDWPGPTMSPLDGIEYAMTRQPLGGGALPRQPGQRISLAAILAAYTRDAAWAAREDAIDGVIAPGMHADLVVLERNLFAVDAHEIHTVRVRLTLLDGKMVYRGGETR